MKPQIIPFKTKNQKYIFDAFTRYVYPVNEIEEKIINSYKIKQKNKLIDELTTCHNPNEVQKAYKKVEQWIEQDFGFYPPENSNSFQPKFVDASKFEKSLKNNCRQMILGITERCNLRCKYCVFSGNYKYYRIHSNMDMEWEVARKSIDYFIKLISSPRSLIKQNHFFLGFYGGEPLLNFGLIKKCVDYVYSKSCDNIIFTLTTNGTLLTRNIIEFLIKNRFALIISLDGPQNVHDKNRIYCNSKGSFDRVFRNIQLIKEIDQEYYYSYVSFISVLLPSSDLFDVYLFFSRNKLVRKKFVKFSNASKKDSKLHEQLSKMEYEKWTIQNDYLYKKFCSELLNGTDKITPLFYLYNKRFSEIKRRNHGLARYSNFHTGTCFPGTKIFVDPIGNYHVCEKINYDFPIGNYKQGVVYDLAKSLWEKYFNSIDKKCFNCPIFSMCNKCFANCAEGKQFNINQDCDIQIKNFSIFLKHYFSILEENPLVFKKLFDSRKFPENFED